jgi:hypothetical protein
MWTGIIVFGIANGFILLPVLLSLIGPLHRRDLTGPTKEIIETPESEEEYCKVITDRDMEF